VVVETIQLSPVRTVRVGSFGAEVVGQEFRSEMDSHADTCVVSSKTSLIVNDFGRPVRVHGYDETVSEKEHCRTVSGVVAYDDPTSGETYMLVINQAIEIPSVKMNLLSPMQLRDNDLYVNEEPKHMALNPTEDLVRGIYGKSILKNQHVFYRITMYSTEY
jgi:hypothetical protein